ncbi:metal-dependent hydrolase [Roseisolibacter agri]|uniref:Uncharacterized protein n=1 Tax=Roseisolibacter agri TaxID=2014610 RepID=A0AA37VA13_9BACT|nr:metal-dependent hydrolase [Roseisolibacter agri]GLC24973.1 hypothetical protein rosag_14860 [Roseisolibacter agri]
MFLGHYGVAFAARRAAPRASLGTTILAAQLLDELWPVLLLLGVERVRIVPGLMTASALDFVSYPISHSLLTAAGWALLLAGVHFALRRRGRDACILGAAVVSHWLLDAPMHRPDLPLWPGSRTLVGGGLWNSVPATLAIELGILGVGLALYVRGTRARDRVGRWGLGAMVALLVVLFVGAVYGPPPPSERALALSSLGLWLFVPWGWWIDRHRAPASRSP